MSKKNIYETKAAHDAAKRFRMLCEYTFNITEDDGEQEVEMDMEPQDDESPEMNPNEMQGMDDKQGDNIGNPQEQEMNGDMNTGQEGGAPGFNPMGGGEVENLDNNPESDDEVIDVDDLTKSQETTEEKVDDIHVTMEKGFDKLLNVVDKLNKMIDASTTNMEEIRQEIEKRNPTPLEKLNMRAANDSYPFNISPDDYWKEKEATSNYRIGGENEEDSKQYIITQGDIDDMIDYRRISKELDDSEYNQNLMNIFGLK